MWCRLELVFDGDLGVEVLSAALARLGGTALPLLLPQVSTPGW
jgi:hypothetical protein